VRAPGIAPGTADWQTATLLLRHARTCKLGPCRTWAAGWLHTDPRGQSGLRPRIENRRFLKENGHLDGIRTRIPWLERPGSSFLDDKAEKRTRGRHRRLTPSGAPRVCMYNREVTFCASRFRKKEHTPSSLSSDEVGWIGRPQDLHADVGLIGWAQQVKPLMEYGKNSDSFPEAVPSGHKKPTSGRKWAST
jgi:hypothetical protein